MEGWEHMTIMREIINREDSPVMKWSTKVVGIGDWRNTGKQVSNGHSPHVEEQSKSKGSILQ